MIVVGVQTRNVRGQTHRFAPTDALIRLEEWGLWGFVVAGYTKENEHISKQPVDNPTCPSDENIRGRMTQ